MNGKTVVVTGAAGYVGEMLCEQLALRPDIERVIAIDKSPQTAFLAQLSKLQYIQHNLAEAGWEEQVAAWSPHYVIHTAWQIRSLYGKAAEQRRLNIEGSKRVFDFVFTQPGIESLVHFSTAAAYSARKDNTFEKYFVETDELRVDDYLYAKEKKVSEELLRARFNVALTSVASVPSVTVVRPAAITGPRGRYIRTRFGLQSAVVGNLKGGVLARVVTLLTAFMPATRTFVRQFVHEDDVVDTVIHFSTTAASGYEVFNLTPEGEPLRALAMAKAVGKRVLFLPAFVVRLAFSFFWHATGGRIPTAPGSWRFYAYPLLLSGTKLAAVRPLRYTTVDAFTYTDGRFQSLLPTAAQKPKAKNLV